MRATDPLLDCTLSLDRLISSALSTNCVIAARILKQAAAAASSDLRQPVRTSMAAVSSSSASSSKKKNKNYDFDYEWSGNAGEVKGVNLAEKNPWNKPGWNTVVKADSKTTGNSSIVEQKPTDWQRLQDQHQWSTPEWATMKGKNTSNKTIVKDPVPKPSMLKKKQFGGGANNPKMGAGAGDATNTKGGGSAVTDAEMEIAEMERLIEQARQKKAAMLAQKMKDEEEQRAEAERVKHTVNETALEKARREAKEREEARWRATLAERNARDKEKREQARLAALGGQEQQSKLHGDTSWQKQQSTTTTATTGKNVPIVTSKATAPTKERPAQHQQQSQQPSMTKHEPVSDDGPMEGAVEEYEEEVEYDEEYVDDSDYEEEEYVEETDDEEEGDVAHPARNDADELQRQIAALRQQLASVQK